MAAGPVGLAKIDEEICNLLGRPVHPTQYALGWYDCIGWDLAMGKTFDQIIANCEEILANDEECAKYNTSSMTGDAYWTNMRKIAVFLQENFEPNNWVEIGRRRD